MTEEIKEILDLLKYCVEKNEYLEVTNMKEWKPLLNYITNLQKENEKLKETLQTDKLMKAFMVEHNRNEKAVEFIKNNYIEEYPNEDILLNILQGGDE